MKVEVPKRQMRALARASDEEQAAIVGAMTPADMLSWDADFESWAHKAQLPPRQEGWRTWLMMAGRGFGKTRAGAEWIEKLARSRPNVRIALVGASIDEARRIMVEGVSGVLSVARRNNSKVKWEPSIGRLTWSNGSEAQLLSGDSPDGLRGPEHDFAWGAAATRRRRCRRGRGAAARRPACVAIERPMLCCRQQPGRGLVATCRQACGVQRGRLALRRTGRWHVAPGEDQRNARYLRLGRVGSRYDTRLTPVHRRSASYRTSVYRDRRSSGRGHHRCRGTTFVAADTLRAAPARTDCHIMKSLSLQ